MLRRTARAAVEQVLTWLPSRTTAEDRLILSYHNVVSSRDEQMGDRSLHLLVDDFVRQMDALQEHTEVVPLWDLLHDTTTAASAGRLRVAISFDDAYASALQLGVAECVRRGLPCTIFVAPALLNGVPYWDRAGAASQWSEQERLEFLGASRGVDSDPPTTPPAALRAQRIASLAELQAAAALPGVRIGNHTFDHANLGALSADEVLAQIKRAAEWIVHHVGSASLPVVAYPYGIAPASPNPLRSSQVVSFGLRVTGGIIRGGAPALDAFNVPRWNVPAGISGKGFALRLRGHLIRGNRS